MKKNILSGFIFFALFNPLMAHAALNVLACEPEWGALAQVLGGDAVEVFNASSALQDPHMIQARPSLIARARNADLLVCTGADLEVGWLPLLLRQAANSRIQTGQPGHFIAAEFVNLLEVNKAVDRAQGDVHAQGNPHIQTDPRNIARVAEALSARLARIDAPHADGYRARYSDFSRRWRDAVAHWESRAAPLRGVPIVVQHQGFPYLNQWLGMREVATLEAKPGVEPSVAHLNEILSLLKREPAKFVLRAAYNDGRPSQWLADKVNIATVVVPFSVGGDDHSRDLFELFDETITRLLAGLK